MDGECPVCLERYERRRPSRLATLLSCQHVLCSACVDRLLDGAAQLECPLCRRLTDVAASEQPEMDARSTEKAAAAPAGRCQLCGGELGVDSCAHRDGTLCAECREEHARNGALEGVVLLVDVVYYVSYYVVAATYVVADGALRCASRLFHRLGVWIVASAYAYAAYALVVHLVRYGGGGRDVPRPCVLPWRYDHFYWYSARFELPWDVAVSAQGHVIVSDLARNSVHDLTGDFLYDVAADADVGRGVAVDHRGSTFVSVGVGVHVFDADTGKPTATMAVRGEFDRVRGLAVHRGFLYACAGQGFNVLRTNGSHVMRYNLPMTPHFIAVGPSDEIVVSDAASTVAIYRQKLPEMNQLQQRGEVHAVWLSAGFTRPGGVVVDCDGYIVVSDTGSGRLVKFDADGEFVDYVTEPKALKKPQGLSVSLEGDLVVADHGLGLVRRFSSRCRHSSFTRLLGVPWCAIITGQN